MCGGSQGVNDIYLKQSNSKKPTDWKLVRKRGIVQDELVQSKLANFLLKFPNMLTLQGKVISRNQVTTTLCHLISCNQVSLTLCQLRNDGKP